MSLSFGKLMKEAKKNSEDVSGKLKNTSADLGKKLNSHSGPSSDAVKAFLEKKKAAEKQELNKKLEIKKKLEEQRSKDSKKHKKHDSSENQSSKNSKSAENSSKNLHKSVSPPIDRKVLEQKKLEMALKKAKEKFKNQQKLENHEKSEIKHKKSEKVAASNSKKSKIEPNFDKNHKSLANFKIPSVKISKNQPVDFVKLMQVAVKNRESGVHFDDLDEKKLHFSDKKSNLDLKKLNLNGKKLNLDKNNNARKRKLSNSSDEGKTPPSKNIKIKSKIVPLGPKNKTNGLINGALAGNKKPDMKNKDQILKTKDSKLIKSNPQPSSKNQEKLPKVVSKPKLELKNLVQNGKIVEKSKDVKILNGKTGVKSIDRIVANNKNLKISAGKPIDNRSIDKSKIVASNSKPIVQKPINNPQKSSLSNQKSPHPPIRRPGTPPSVNKLACRRPGTPPSGNLNGLKPPNYRPIHVNLPSTSNQIYAKKSDQQRALMLRREMMFKNPERYAGRQSRDYGDSEYDEDVEDDDDDSLMDFIDDTEYGDEDKFESYTQEIRKMFKYNPDKYKFMDERDDPRMESSYKDIEKEEARSARLGLLEDLEDIQREQQETKRRMGKIKKK